VNGRTVAVFGMLRDKDIAAVLNEMHDVIDGWYLATLAGERGTRAEVLAERVREAGIDKPVFAFESPGQAWTVALSQLTKQDRIVGFGSFYVVGDILALPA